MNHVMLDLETFGTRPGSTLRSIGAVQFDLDGRTGETFYRNITRKSCTSAGLVVDPYTELWWAAPERAAAQKTLEVDQRELADVTRDFAAWFQKNGCVYAWGHGASFDPPLWEAACAAVKVAPPWKFYNIRDTRTVHHILNFETRNLRRRGIFHNALDDALYQVDCLAAAIKTMPPAVVAEGIFA
jgi:hypothetical protein